MAIRMRSNVVSLMAALLVATTALLVAADHAAAGSVGGGGGGAAGAGLRTSTGGVNLPTSQGGVGTALHSNKNGSGATSSTDFKTAPTFNSKRDNVDQNAGIKFVGKSNVTAKATSQATSKKVWEYIRKNNLQDKAKK